jgi:NADPH2:quinone reductase
MRPVKHTRIIVTHYGGPDALQVLEEECPEPKGGEVRAVIILSAWEADNSRTPR